MTLGDAVKVMLTVEVEVTVGEVATREQAELITLPGYLVKTAGVLTARLAFAVTVDVKVTETVVVVDVSGVIVRAVTVAVARGV